MRARAEFHEDPTVGHALRSGPEIKALHFDFKGVTLKQVKILLVCLFLRKENHEGFGEA